ncbi:hypothetical protein [uncultured Phascolarctobacterium sp.]|uniref:hypothetical protein n=1 Tax=uncultured Phascolarctobacterium sp. TaxID=512296 RepID=UPI0027DDF736|nr:hypothetical protein [uncultured Phascolarctobacterium sp.]
MRTFLPLAFWYWLYNQLFFFLGALGFFVIHFLVAFIGFGGMDTLASAILTTLYAFILYKLFGRFLWRNRLQQYSFSSNTLIYASLLPLILGSVVLTASFAIADGKIYNTMTAMPVLAAINLSLSYLPLAKSVWTMLILGSIFNLFTLICFWRYCRKYLQQEIPWLKLLIPLSICLVICTIIIYSITIMYLPDDKVGG